MKSLAIVLFFLIWINPVFSQKTLNFEIKTKLFKLGDVKITQTEYKGADSIKYKLVAKLNVWAFYNIDYLMESVYENGVLTHSLTEIKVNGNMHHYTRTERFNTGYIVHSSEDGIFYQTYPITNSITPLYFAAYTGPDSVFSEYSGRYRPFVRKNDSTLVLDPDDPMEFIFAHGAISRVVVPNTIMNFYIEKSPMP